MPIQQGKQAHAKARQERAHCFLAFMAFMAAFMAAFFAAGATTAFFMAFFGVAFFMAFMAFFGVVAVCGGWFALGTPVHLVTTLPPFGNPQTEV